MTQAEDVLLAVNGTLMRGLELNGNLIAAGATFVRESETAPTYRLWSMGTATRPCFASSRAAPPWRSKSGRFQQPASQGFSSPSRQD